MPPPSHDEPAVASSAEWKYQPAVVFCTSGEFIRLTAEDYRTHRPWNGGAIQVQTWNIMSAEEQLQKLLIHWAHCGCSGTENKRMGFWDPVDKANNEHYPQCAAPKGVGTVRAHRCYTFEEVIDKTPDRKTILLELAKVKSPVPPTGVHGISKVTGQHTITCLCGRNFIARPGFNGHLKKHGIDERHAVDTISQNKVGEVTEITIRCRCGDGFSGDDDDILDCFNGHLFRNQSKTSKTEEPLIHEVLGIGHGWIHCECGIRWEGGACIESFNDHYQRVRPGAHRLGRFRGDRVECSCGATYKLDSTGRKFLNVHFDNSRRRQEKQERTATEIRGLKVSPIDPPEVIPGHALVSIQDTGGNYFGITCSCGWSSRAPKRVSGNPTQELFHEHIEKTRCDELPCPPGHGLTYFGTAAYEGGSVFVNCRCGRQDAAPDATGARKKFEEHINRVPAAEWRMPKHIVHKHEEVDEVYDRITCSCGNWRCAAPKEKVLSRFEKHQQEERQQQLMQQAIAYPCSVCGGPSHDFDYPCHPLTKEHEEPMPEQNYRLYTVAAYNPEDGKILLEARIVSAKSSDSAHNKAVALLAADLDEGQSLSQLLDDIEIIAVPFSR